MESGTRVRFTAEEKVGDEIIKGVIGVDLSDIAEYATSQGLLFIRFKGNEEFREMKSEAIEKLLPLLEEMFTLI